jgi:hypothetical protein
LHLSLPQKSSHYDQRNILDVLPEKPVVRVSERRKTTIGVSDEVEIVPD